MPRRLAVALALGGLTIPVAAIAAPGDVTRQSLTWTGAQAGAGVDGAVFTPDGSRVLFTSAAPLTGVPTGGSTQLFMRDLATGRLTLVSSSATGVPAGAPVDDPADARAYGASLDGRYVVFSSTARNLVASDANGTARDVFRKDTLTGRVVVVSRDARGTQPSDGVAGEPSISSDGSRIAFSSGAQPLVAADSNGRQDVYLADLRAGGVTLVSRSSADVQSPEPTGRPAISADGRAVAFEGTAAASVLAAGDTDGHADVYVARPAARSIVVASVADGGADTGDSTLPSISGDGSVVAFASAAPLVAGDPGTGTDAYVRDLRRARTLRASSGDITGAPAVDIPGARVAFAGDEVTTGDINVTTDVLVRTLATGDVYRASRRPDGTAPVLPSTRPALSGDGALAAFTYTDNGVGADSPVTGDSNRQADVFTTALGAVAPAIAGPALTARATTGGRRVTVAGNASSRAGITAVTVGRRVARLAEDGSYAVSFTAPIGTAAVTVEARDGLGANTRVTVEVTRQAGGRGAPAIAPRPRITRVTVKRPWVTATLRLPTTAAWRVELRKRVTGPARNAAFRLVASRSGAPTAGTRTVRLRVPKTTRAGRYQVRVLMSSQQGLGTTARTVDIP